MLAAFPTFAYGDRFARKYVLLSGGVLTFVATVGIIASSSLAALLFFAAFFGAGLVITEAAGFALLADATEDAARARTFGLSFAAVSVAYFAAYAFGGSLAAPVAAWLGRPESDPLALRALLGIAALIGAASGIPVLLLSSRGHAAHVDAPAPGRSWGASSSSTSASASARAASCRSSTSSSATGTGSTSRRSGSPSAS